jgi:hypothetical protein
MLETPVKFYRVYHINAVGQRVEYRTFTATEDAHACEVALAIKEETSWPTIEVWGNHGEISCGAESPDASCPDKVNTEDSYWRRKIELALGYAPRAKQLRVEAAAMTDLVARQLMLRIAADYEHLADPFRPTHIVESHKRQTLCGLESELVTTAT